MINIALILTPIEFGGAERVCLNLLKAYSRSNFNIIPILLIRPWEKKSTFADEIEKLGITYFTIPVAIRPLHEGKDRYRILRCYYVLFRILNKARFNIIHTNGYFADILGIPIAKILRIPHIATCHGYIDNDSALKMYNKVDMMMLRFSERIITVAESIKKKLIEQGVNEKLVRTITNSVLIPDLTRSEMLERRTEARVHFKIDNDEIALGYVGRLSEEKGLEFAISAVGKLVELGRRIKLILIGDGPQRLRLENIAKNENVKDRVIFAGFQSNVNDLLPGLDIFILPSLTEGTPMALLEAMSYGIPTVASAVGGVPKVIDNRKSGMLVPPGNVKELVEALDYIILNPEYRNHLSVAGRVNVLQKYGLKNWIINIETLYFELSKIETGRC
jgi:glycosyltransferase involved in cell wall biosynthesis